MPAAMLVPLPDAISVRDCRGHDAQGHDRAISAAPDLYGEAGDTILFHAAAGGVGLIVGQWAKHLGATVIGTVSSPEKAELARAHGYDHVIDYKREDFVARVSEITGGAGVPVVYDGVGKDTFMRSLDCLRPLRSRRELRQLVGSGRELRSAACSAPKARCTSPARR